MLEFNCYPEIIISINKNVLQNPLLFPDSKSNNIQGNVFNLAHGIDKEPTADLKEKKRKKKRRKEKKRIFLCSPSLLGAHNPPPAPTCKVLRLYIKHQVQWILTFFFVYVCAYLSEHVEAKGQLEVLAHAFHCV